MGLPPPAAALWTPPYGGTQRGYAHMHTFAHICMYTIYKPPYIRMPPRTSRVAAKCRKLAPSRSTGCVRTAAMASPARRSAPGMGTGWQAGRLGLQAGRLGLQARDTWGCRRAVRRGAVRCGAECTHHREEWHAADAPLGRGRGEAVGARHVARLAWLGVRGWGLGVRG